jgi:hypothetical protein
MVGAGTIPAIQQFTLQAAGLLLHQDLNTFLRKKSLNLVKTRKSRVALK